MDSEIEIKLLKEINELKKEIDYLKDNIDFQIPTYQYSKIRDSDLKELFEIEKNLNVSIFDEWFNNDLKIDQLAETFLKDLIQENKLLTDVTQY